MAVNACFKFTYGYNYCNIVDSRKMGYCWIHKSNPFLVIGRAPLFKPIRLSKNKAVVMGEAVAANDDDDLIFPDQDFAHQAHVPNFQKYLEMYTRSIEDPAGFWSEMADDFYWKKKWGQQVNSENLDITKGNIKIEWFKGGITNICYNCLDRNIEAGNGEKIAIHWEGNDR
ncbi:hypothetical protein M8C21_003768, partial [Ambrosia artemisiifolia]